MNLKVRTYEMSPDVGHRKNSVFQGLENWSSDNDTPSLLNGIGVDINFMCVPYCRGNIYAPKTDPLEIKSEKPIFYLVKRGGMRGSFDAGLKEQVLSFGVEILFGTHFVSVSGNGVIGIGSKKEDFIAVGITFDTEMKYSATVVFNDEIAPKGYAYLLVNNGSGTMATVIYRDYRNEKKYFDNMLKFFKSNIKELNIKNDKRFGGCGNFFLKDANVDIDTNNVEQKTIYVGESAGFQDCLWGFGMRYAIVSGYLAAMSIIKNSDYDLLWKKELKPMLETSLVNRYLFEKFGNIGYKYIAKRFAKGDPCDFLKYHYNQTFFKNLLLPIAKRKYGNIKAV